MIDVGGPNLPKTISSSLGAKLGKLYKGRGIVILNLIMELVHTY